jgi:hypothetical protein
VKFVATPAYDGLICSLYCDIIAAIQRKAKERRAKNMSKAIEVENLVFIFFSGALVSLYAGLAVLLIEGLPLANAFKPSAVSAMPVIYLMGLGCALAVSVIQWLLFHFVYLVLAGAIMIAAPAFIVAHLSLGGWRKRFV